MVPSLLDVSSGAGLHRLSRSEPATDDRALPLSSTTVHVRQATVTDIAAEGDAAHDAAVKRAYANINAQKIERVTPMPFHAALDKTDAAHQLARSVKLAAADILVQCDDKCFYGLGSKSWVSGVGTPASQMRSESHHTRQTFHLRPH